MKPSVRIAFVGFTAPLEGVVPWMYLDVKGLVTCAIGILADPMPVALVLPWVRPDGSEAPRDEIAAAWQNVKNRPELARLGHRVAARYTTIRLTPEGIDRVVLNKLQNMELQLLNRFPEFEAWPADAQLATLSMAWACGPAFAFPHLAARLRARDFSGAALHCHISEQGNPGVIPRNRANKTLYRNASYAIHKHMDTDVLYYPRDLLGEPDTDPEIEPYAAEPTTVTNSASFPTVTTTAEMVEESIASYRKRRDGA